LISNLFIISSKYNTKSFISNHHAFRRLFLRQGRPLLLAVDCRLVYADSSRFECLTPASQARTLYAIASTVGRSLAQPIATTSLFQRTTLSWSPVRPRSSIYSSLKLPLLQPADLNPYPNHLTESGTPKTISKKADSGKEITSHFCPDCGTTVFRTGESFPQAVVIKAGVLDSKDWASENVPKAELFAGNRVDWIPAIEGAGQIPAMP